MIPLHCTLSKHSVSANCTHFAMAPPEKGERYSDVEVLVQMFADSDEDNMSGSKQLSILRREKSRDVK